jgi:UDP-2,4-diacetamido-2,4,6-trideoxy-beta-L-altropyranose hydrolase
MKQKILFRADGHSKTGLGHLYRLFALVEMLKNDYEFTFITRASSTISVIPKSYSVQLIPEHLSIEQEPEWLAKQFDSKTYILIADGYQFISEYQKMIKNFGYKMVFIDDLTSEFMYADLIINHSPFVKIGDFNATDSTKFALGTKYAILRPSFLEMASKDKQIDTINTAFICFGGSDIYNLSVLAVKALLELHHFKKIYVVIGAAYKHKAIFDISKSNSIVNIKQNLNEKELITVMDKSQFGIAPASTILYELCCVKMPVLSGFYVDNQELIYKGFVENDAIFKGGNFKDYSINDFKKNSLRIINEQAYSKYINAQKNLFDNQIKDRFLTLINDLC